MIQFKSRVNKYSFQFYQNKQIKYKQSNLGFIFGDKRPENSIRRISNLVNYSPVCSLCERHTCLPAIAWTLGHISALESWLAIHSGKSPSSTDRRGHLFAYVKSAQIPTAHSDHPPEQCHLLSPWHSFIPLYFSYFYGAYHFIIYLSILYCIYCLHFFSYR